MGMEGELEGKRRRKNYYRRGMVVVLMDFVQFESRPKHHHPQRPCQRHDIRRPIVSTSTRAGTLRRLRSFVLDFDWKRHV